MSSQQHSLLIAVSAIASAVYMAPTLIGVMRHGAGAWRILAINALLGWTLFGWLWALKLAFAAPMATSHTPTEWVPWSPGRPESPQALRPADSTYADGSYLISEAGGARTWAICSGGRWGIAFELDGLQRTASWVDSCDVPIEVLARGLTRNDHPERRA